MPSIDFVYTVAEEYGMSPLAAAHVAARGWAARAAKINTAGGYVATVRRAQGWAGPPPAYPALGYDRPHDGPDGRLLAPLWRECPVAPSNRARIDAWLAYWDATQARPSVVGSEYNAKPEAVASAFRLGLPAGMVARAGRHLPVLPARWAGNRERILALLALAQAGADGPERFCTADLRRLAKLPRWVLRRVYVRETPAIDGRRSRVDWVDLAASIAAQKATLPVADLLAARVPYAYWDECEARAWDTSPANADRARTMRAWVADVALAQRAGVGGDRRWYRARRFGLTWGVSPDPLQPLFLIASGGVDRDEARKAGAEGYVLDEDSFGTLILPVPGQWDARMGLRVRVENATPDADGTRRVFHLRVPPWVRTAREAVAWTFALEPAQYAPVTQA